MNHNVEHGAAACPLTYSNCNHNVELVFALSLVLDSKENHNVEHGAVACPHTDWLGEESNQQPSVALLACEASCPCGYRCCSHRSLPGPCWFCCSAESAGHQCCDADPLSLMAPFILFPLPLHLLPQSVCIETSNHEVHVFFFTAKFHVLYYFGVLVYGQFSKIISSYFSLHL